MPRDLFSSLCFTDFSLRKWTENDLSENNIQYVAYGVETCPETKKIHHQGWLYSNNSDKRSFKTWKKLFAKLGLEKMHFEQMKGSFMQNTAYVSKEGTLIEIGVKPMENGKKRKLLEFKEAIDQGKNVLEIADSPSLFGTFLQYRSEKKVDLLAAGSLTFFVTF